MVMQQMERVMIFSICGFVRLIWKGQLAPEAV